MSTSMQMAFLANKVKLCKPLPMHLIQKLLGETIYGSIKLEI